MLQIVLLGAGIAWVAYLLIRHAVKERRHRRQAREWACQPPPRERGTWYGAKITKEFIQAAREERAPQYFIEWAERNPKSYMTPFFDVDIFQTCEPANIQAILGSQFEDFGLGHRLNSWSPMFGKGIFTTDGAEWKHQRAMLRPQFARMILQDLETEEKHHRNLLAHLTVRADGWTDRVDLQPLFMRLTMDSSTELLFGESTDSQLAALRGEQKDGTAVGWSSFNRAYERGLKTVGIRNFLEELHWLYNPSHYKDDVRVVHAFADHFVQQGLRRADIQSTGTPKKYCFLDELVKETRNPVELRNYLLNILVAGRDTTSSALGWTFYLLAHNTGVFHKLRQVVLRDFGSYDSPRNLDFASIKACTYLQHVLNESLRLYPPVPANARHSVRDTTLPIGGGPDGKSPVYIRKGLEVAYFVGAMHRRTDLWGDDANEFRPDRWIGRKPKWDYLPFSGGPRICLGQQQALTLAGFTIIRLLQKFDDIQAADYGERTRHVFTLTDAPRYCWVKLHEATRS
ncbi:hypothetical protein PV08_03463 [Exophiala spinifera]|uniref:Cytochrome P450 n=1 Tax=Exophiala spinifera TaxID=91928 RepID=A0A0D2BKQ2_9EURO|nr:uncharacterized protein PV08_03463 [Exophiala spinifera]KIW19170.1 hypothetical protein PV08_03463 [Exophiala spinifera]